MDEKMTRLSKRKYSIDLIIIFLTSMAVLLIYGIVIQIVKFDTGDMPILTQTFIGALLEYGIMGLGITIVCILRKENFRSFGLKKDKLLITIALSALVCLPELINTAVKGELHSYLPFQGVNFTKSILASGLPINIIGMIIIAASWGFFEGFSYAVISDRINKRFPSKNFWLNWGAIACGIFCILIHGAVGLAPGAIIDALCTFILIYGMLVVYDYTGNAWGCVFIYFVYWNAIA